MAACWLAYLSSSDRKQPELAARYLERCLELFGLVGEAMRDTLMLEGAIFQAWERDNVEKATKWIELVKTPKRLPKLMQLRSTIAISCAKRDFTSAHTDWQEGWALIEKLPPTPVRDVAIASWSERLAEIREREETVKGLAHLPTPL